MITVPAYFDDAQRQATKDAAKLARFTRNTGCAADEVAGADGRLSILYVFEAMRRRGYHVTEPVRPQQQPRAGCYLLVLCGLWLFLFFGVP